MCIYIYTNIYIYIYIQTQKQNADRYNGGIAPSPGRKNRTQTGRRRNPKRMLSGLVRLRQTDRRRVADTIRNRYREDSSGFVKRQAEEEEKKKKEEEERRLSPDWPKKPLCGGSCHINLFQAHVLLPVAILKD